jgi:glycosyltransferase involved in cell wall biosynthesis
VKRPLRIGVDARELLGDTTGVGRYLAELMRRWTGRDDADRRRFTLYAPERPPIMPPPGTVELRVIGTGTGTWWEQTTLGPAVRADKPDVFFAPAYTAPVALGIPIGVTIHDISFVAHPEWYRPRERWRRRLLTAKTAATAAAVFTDSEFSRSELQTRLHVEGSRIRVIAPGIGAADSGVPYSSSEPGRPAREPLVLYVGSLFNRRRLPDLIAAFARAAKDVPDARLVIVGADRTWPPQDLAAAAASHGVGPRVELRSYVADGDLAALYARAAVFAFLSEYEGFGLTPLEALAARVPIVVADTAVAREVYGPAAEYVRTGDLDGTAAVLRRFLLSPSAGSGQMAHAAAVLARYSWDRCAADTLDALEGIAAR